MEAFEAMRATLEETRLELGALFERGLCGAGHREESLAACGERMARSGMTAGAQLAAGLCGQLAASRLDARWAADEAASLLARLWRYTGLCLRRLEFLEARASLTE